MLTTGVCIRMFFFIHIINNNNHQSSNSKNVKAFLFEFSLFFFSFCHRKQSASLIYLFLSFLAIKTNHSLFMRYLLGVSFFRASNLNQVYDLSFPSLHTIKTDWEGVSFHSFILSLTSNSGSDISLQEGILHNSYCIDRG